MRMTRLKETEEFEWRGMLIFYEAPPRSLASGCGGLVNSQLSDTGRILRFPSPIQIDNHFVSAVHLLDG